MWVQIEQNCQKIINFSKSQKAQSAEKAGDFEFLQILEHCVHSARLLLDGGQQRGRRGAKLFSTLLVFLRVIRGHYFCILLLIEWTVG